MAPCTPGAIFTSTTCAWHNEAINAFAVESSTLTQPLYILARNEEWCGTTSELLDAINEIATAAERRRADWPTTIFKLSNALRRLASSPRAFDILVEFTRVGHVRRRIIQVRRVSYPTREENEE